MSRKKLSRNAPCPCGSGKKYKDCCWDKGFKWVEAENGTVYKSIAMSPAVKQFLEQLRQTFIAKHGREPGPDDLVFPDLPHPEHLEHMMVEDMKAAGMDPAFIYAFEQTGLLVTEQNMHLISGNDLAEWNVAVEEYEAKRRKKKRRPKYPVGIVALYRPDDQTTTKVTAVVIEAKDSQPVMRRWVGTSVMENPKVERQRREFFTRYGVDFVTMSEGNMGCPHEDSLDYPQGEDCPFCPFWKGKQGNSRRD